MREILFRAKRKDNKKWIEGYLLKYSPIYEEATCILPLHSVDVTDVGVIPETVCQYTGLTDKNGRKIFENDIVGIYSDYRGEWDYGIVKYGAFNCPCCDGVYGWYFDGEDIRDCVLYEVKGNIIDNGDLLKE